MSKLAIGLLTLVMYTTSLPVISIISTPARAETISNKHIKQQHRKNILRSPGVSDAWPASRQAWPVTGLSSLAGPVCPGIARGIDCRIWPPPLNEDPDRKRAGGGGG
jgi:hypothetical protein